MKNQSHLFTPSDRLSTLMFAIMITLMFALVSILSGCQKSTEIGFVAKPTVGLTGDYKAKEFLPTESFTFTIDRHYTQPNMYFAHNLVGLY